jgi:mono/diheme cytochrome c family protein
LDTQTDNINDTPGSYGGMKEYLKLYGLVYVIFIIILIGLGTVYLDNVTMFAKEKIVGSTMPAKDTTKDTTKEADLPMVKGVISPPVDVSKYLNPTPDMVEKGKTMFSTTCATCHGPEGKGDGVAGVLLNPKPRNFHEMTGWKNGPEINRMYKTLQEGIPNSGMASYANVPPEDRFNVIMYVRTFNPAFPPVTKAQLDSIDLVYSLLKGVKQPNQIPVKLAIEKVLQDNEMVNRKVSYALSVIENAPKDSGAVIFKQISSNLTMSLSLLAADTSWMNNQKSFVNLITTNLGSNGYKPRAYTLTPGEADTVFQYLKKLFGSYKS